MLYDGQINCSHTIRAGDPGDKMSEWHVVLDDCGDAVVHPVEGEGVLSNIVVRKTLDKVQRQNWRSSEDKTESSCQAKRPTTRIEMRRCQRSRRPLVTAGLFPSSSVYCMIQEWEKTQRESRNYKKKKKRFENISRWQKTFIHSLTTGGLIFLGERSFLIPFRKVCHLSNCCFRTHEHRVNFAKEQDPSQPSPFL